MKTSHWQYSLLSVLLAITLPATANEQCVNDQALISKELSQQHGKAFKVFNESYEIPGGFENPAHYRCLYFKDIAITRVGPTSVSPGGDYIVFNAAEEGLWMLMDLKGKTRHLTRVKSLQHYKGIKWDNNKGTVTIVYDKQADSTSFDL